ncbi:uncharacterized protein YALI1_E28070g [Yarrowia lipolytica]|uniref:Uncharacterized protein n=1 Tax=Yarrowia lipolytica TaxID=4952 RepID=A0A1D8NJR4_YARLL|nr:hypothetical protein YALI1_E28070g [Yarrowia lipolytica]
MMPITYQQPDQLISTNHPTCSISSTSSYHTPISYQYQPHQTNIHPPRSYIIIVIVTSLHHGNQCLP